MPCSWRPSVACVLWTSMPSMCTGPLVSSRTRLAIRKASTTPWQYPRGVILRTSMVSFESTRRLDAAQKGARQRALADTREEVVFRELGTRLPSDQLVVLRPEHELVDLAR